MIQANGFESYCEADIIIDCDIDTVYQALFDLEDWSKLLPHVRAIDVLYDDGRYQEFLMTVDSNPGQIKVRSVRNCDRGKMHIDFFQPQPPKFLKHHAGGWDFIRVGENKCRVSTYHQWNIKADVAAETFKDAEQGFHERVKIQLLEHAEFALQNWKQILESQTAQISNAA
jgi:ribosome-associated toxin RatA of RatAB toxin-antitoxin module